jgi:hypothetical protein
MHAISVCRASKRGQSTRRNLKFVPRTNELGKVICLWKVWYAWTQTFIHQYKTVAPVSTRYANLASCSQASIQTQSPRFPFSTIMTKEGGATELTSTSSSIEVNPPPPRSLPLISSNPRQKGETPFWRTFKRFSCSVLCRLTLASRLWWLSFTNNWNRWTRFTTFWMVGGQLVLRFRICRLEFRVRGIVMVRIAWDFRSLSRGNIFQLNTMFIICQLPIFSKDQIDRISSCLGLLGLIRHIARYTSRWAMPALLRIYGGVCCDLGLRTTVWLLNSFIAWSDVDGHKPENTVFGNLTHA